MNLGPFLDDDDRPLELAHALGVDPEIGLQGDVDLHAGGDVNERATRPDRGVERGEFVVVDRDDRAEIFLDEVGVFADGRVGVDEDDALLLKVLTQAVVNDLGLVLRRRRPGTFARPRGFRACRTCS